MISPSGSQVSMSLTEWMAQSTVPASSASSISLVNRPLPPISISLRSCTLSPVVLMTEISTAPALRRAGWASPSRRFNSSAWASASGLPRVPMRSGCLLE